MKTHFGVFGQAGFSLLETFIAVFILSVGLLALGLLQVKAVKSNVDAIDRTTAVNIAQSIMEDLKRRPFFDDDTKSDWLVRDWVVGNDLDDGRAVGSGQPNPALADYNRFSDVRVNNGQVFSVFWNVEKDEPISGARTLRLFVYWTDEHLGVRSVVTTTVLGGLY